MAGGDTVFDRAAPRSHPGRPRRAGTAIVIFRFDDYELDDAVFELRGPQGVCALPRKSFDLLHYLLLHPDRVVSKEEIFATLWRGENVSDSVLPVNILTIRKAMGEERSHDIIGTVRGRGYRIQCPVECIDSPAPAAAAAPDRSPFVGREGVMKLLAEDRARAAAGEGRVVLLFGDAGIGKTRTLDEFTKVCRASGALTIHVRCPDDQGAPPLWTVMKLLKEGGRIAGSPSVRTSLERSGFDFERARASIARYVNASAGGMDGRDARFELTQAVLRILSRVSRVFPVVLLVDDLHCMDEASAHVCEAVLREISSWRVMCVAAYRDSELRRGTVVARMIGSISGQEGLRQIRLRGLDRRGVSDFVRGETGADPLPDLVEALVERTEGNPFFLRETLRLLVAEGGLDASSARALARLGLAQGIRDTVGRRLDSISRECNQVLTWGAVIGRRFSVPILAEVCNRPPTELLELLAEAEHASIIVSELPGAGSASPLEIGELAFAHGLIRETIYHEMSGPERVLRHRAVAEALERQYGTSSPMRSFELAKHFFEAAPGGDIDRAVHYSVMAARLALGRYAGDDAILHFDQALRAEELRVPRHDLRYCCVVLARADALWRAGRYAAAQQEFRRSARLARELERFDLLCYAALGMVGWPRLNRLSFGDEEPQVRRGEVSALVREGLQGLGDDNPSLRARLLAVLVRLSHDQMGDETRGLAEASLDLARKSGDARALFHALHAKQAALVLPEELDLAIALVSEAVELALRLRGPTRILAAYEARIPLLMMLGDMERADADIAAAETIANDLGSPAHLYATKRFVLARALGDGRLADAAALARSVVELGDRIGDEGARPAADQVSFWILATNGKLKHLAKSAGPLHAALEENLPVAAYFHMLAADPERCREAFERIAREGFATLRRREGGWLWHLCAAADCAVYLGDEERAAELYDLIAPHAHTNVMNRLYCYRGSAAGALGRIAHLLGRREEALDLLEQALAFNRRIGNAPSIVWIEFAIGAVLREGTRAERKRAMKIFARVEQQAVPAGVGAIVLESLRDLPPVPAPSTVRRRRDGTPPSSPR